MAENIYPIYDKMMSRSDKENLLRQRGVLVWFTGLSGSGKSTVALGLERELHSRGILCVFSCRFTRHKRRFVCV